MAHVIYLGTKSARVVHVNTVLIARVGTAICSLRSDPPEGNFNNQNVSKIVSAPKPFCHPVFLQFLKSNFSMNI